MKRSNIGRNLRPGVAYAAPEKSTGRTLSEVQAKLTFRKPAHEGQQSVPFGLTFCEHPSQLGPEEAIFLDGLPQSAEIANLSFKRLCASLSGLALQHGKREPPANFIAQFLDV